jgi:hypothetical protein
LHDVFNDPRNHYNFLYNFLYFYNTRHLDNLLNYLLYYDTHLFNDFLFDDDGYRYLLDYLYWHLLSVRDHFFYLQSYDLGFVLDVWNVKLDDNRLFFAQPDRYSLLYFDISELQHLSYDRLLDQTVHLYEDFLAVASSQLLLIPCMVQESPE